MAGFKTDRNIVDGREGDILLRLQQALDDATAHNAWLLDDAQTDAFFKDATVFTPPYTDTEIQARRGAFGAAAKLRSISHGQDVQATADNFWFFAKKLLGVLFRAG